MPDPASKSEYGPGTGSGRRVIPADLYLSRWNHVVDLLKAGMLSSEIKETHGTCPETVRHVRRFMIEGGWTPPERVRTKSVRPATPPSPPRDPMTPAERLRKYAGIVEWLRAGKTNAQAAQLEGVSVNTVRVVRRAILARGETLDNSSA